MGDDGRTERFGSSARVWGWDVDDEFASMKELTRDCGPKENDELMEFLRWRELDGDGRRGMAGTT